jgi:hypothetical protein
MRHRSLRRRQRVSRGAKLVPPLVNSERPIFWERNPSWAVKHGFCCQTSFSSPGDNYRLNRSTLAAGWKRVDATPARLDGMVSGPRIRNTRTCLRTYEKSAEGFVKCLPPSQSRMAGGITSSCNTVANSPERRFSDLSRIRNAVYPWLQEYQGSSLPHERVPCRSLL